MERRSRASQGRKNRGDSNMLGYRSVKILSCGVQTSAFREDRISLGILKERVTQQRLMIRPSVNTMGFLGELIEASLICGYRVLSRVYIVAQIVIMGLK